MIYAFEQILLEIYLYILWIASKKIQHQNTQAYQQFEKRYRFEKKEDRKRSLFSFAMHKFLERLRIFGGIAD